MEMALSAPTDLIDIGLNLTHDSFDTDRDSVLARAAEQGVHRMIVTGSDIAHSRRALELVADVPARLRSTAGVHPHHASQFAAHDRNELMALVHDPGVVAVGECGLDYFRNFSSHEDQERVFRMQLEIATSVNKPVFLHQRDAHEPFTAILRDYIGALSAGGVAHCFTAGRAEAGAYLDMGLYIGITGWICDERRGMHLREVARYIPQDRLLKCSCSIGTPRVNGIGSPVGATTLKLHIALPMRNSSKIPVPDWPIWSTAASTAYGSNRSQAMSRGASKVPPNGARPICRSPASAICAMQTTR